MVERSITSLLSLFPRGMTDAQLLWRLRRGGLRPDPSSLLASLTRLAERGEVRREGNRWHLGAFAESPPGSNRALEQIKPSSATKSNAGGLLRAVLASIGNSDATRTTTVLPDEDTEARNPPWQAVLRYFAATQRRDPRGSVERFPDQHGSTWQLIHGAGRWWDGAELALGANALPNAFRESLARSGPQGTASIGWPVSVFHDDTGTLCLPALLVPAIWRLEPDRLILITESIDPTLNPAWTRQIRRRTRWTEDELIEAILGGDDAAKLDDIAPRLAHALAKVGGALMRPAELAPEMSLAHEGLRNVGGIFLADESAFTRRVAEDLDTLAEWSPELRSQTALSRLLEPEREPIASPPTQIGVAEPTGLADVQFEAAVAALNGPLTVIQGPPGTGKSHTIVALISSALAKSQSVLFVARNHRAIDEVEQRMNALIPDSPIITRGRDSEGERDKKFTDALVDLTQAERLPPDDALAARATQEALKGHLTLSGAARLAAIERDRLALQLSELTDRADEIRTALPSVTAWPMQKPLWRRMRDWLARMLARRIDLKSPLRDLAPLGEVEARMRALQRELDRIPLAEPSEKIELTAMLRAICRATAVPDEATLAHLLQRKAELEFQRGGLKLRSLSVEDARTILRHRPVWAVSSLSVPARIPLFSSLFDIAIFDEASQCDIASALPVLARSRRAIVVGDPQQLSFIPGLGRAQEYALMDAAGLPKAGRATWAQSINSLYDFAAHRLPPERTFMLRDQFRSAPEIVDYTSRAFYGGRLVARRTDGDFRAPSAYRPGLHWEDVSGAPAREDGGNVNRTEAEWLVKRLSVVGSDPDFDGSVGVISPFNAQVGLIRRLVQKTLDAKTQERLRIHVDTVDRWQGGEADVVFFSLVVGRGAPQSALTFLSRERRRFNVAISRAKAAAVVVGDLAWARSCGIAHVTALAERATRSPTAPPELFDSKWERRVHEALKRRGLEPQPQFPIGSRRLDFALFEGAVKLDLEVDGRRWHIGADGERKTSDRLRDRELIAKGWKVRRFWVHELQQDMERCLDIVERDLGRR